MLFVRIINIPQSHGGNPLFVPPALTMGSHRASFTSGPRPLCKQDFKEKHKDKAQLPRKEGVSTACCSEPCLRLPALLLASRPRAPPHLICLWRISIIYPDLGVQNQFSSWFSRDSVGIRKENGRERKQIGESIQMDKFTNPRFVF